MAHKAPNGVCSVCCVNEATHILKSRVYLPFPGGVDSPDALPKSLIVFVCGFCKDLEGKDYFVIGFKHHQYGWVVEG